MFIYILGKIQLYSSQHKKKLCELDVDTKHPHIVSIACSPIDNTFITTSSDSVNRHNLSFNTSPPNNKNYPPCLLDKHPLGNVCIWDWKTMKARGKIDVQPRPFALVSTAYNHNGNLLLTGAVDGMIRLYDISNQNCIMGWHAHAGEVRFYISTLWIGLKLYITDPNFGTYSIYERTKNEKSCFLNVLNSEWQNVIRHDIVI